MVPKILIEAVQKRQAERTNEMQHEIQQLKWAAWKEVRRLVEEFKKEDPELKRVILFGSLARDAVRSPNFDIDLAYLGREYYRCVSIALDSDFKVDMVDYNSTPDFIREEIDTGGKILYDSHG